MSELTPPEAVVPGRCIGFLTLGVSLHDILCRLKACPRIYQSIDLSFSSSEPIALPIVVNLIHNGLRLRFDGADQRLRLIEMVDFTRTKLSYNGEEIYKWSDSASSPVQVGALSPTFRHIHKLFGAAPPGEYIAPTNPSVETYGTYILSYPGIAFSFPLLHSVWKPGADSAKVAGLLMSSAALPALSLALFSGHSWPEARRTLFTADAPHPRSLALSQRGKELRPSEIEVAKLHGEGRIELVRKYAEPFWITLSQTTPQDLITELGPPDGIYKKIDRRSDIHRERVRDSRSNSMSPAHGEYSSETDYASSHTEDSDGDETQMSIANRKELESAEVFYNYFSHGFDLLISQPTAPSPKIPVPTKRTGKGSQDDAPKPAVLAANHLVATKLILHGNVPGSYTFNRHRRVRWTLEHISMVSSGAEPLCSETRFDDMRGSLEAACKGLYGSEEDRRRQHEPMSFDREVGDSPSSSCELVAGPMEGMRAAPGRAEHGEEDVGEDRSRVNGSMQIWPFPGMLFEVLRNGAISALTVF